jgi:ComF family protein
MTGGRELRRRIVAALKGRRRVAGVVRCGDGVLGALAEFLAPDLCLLCRRPAHGQGGPLPAGCAPLAEVTVVSPLPPFRVANHPFCRPCLGYLVPAPSVDGRIGVCGVSGGAGWTRTEEGDLFVHRPQEAAGSVPGVPPPVTDPEPVCVVSPLLMNDTSLEIIRYVKFGGRRSIIPLLAGTMYEALGSQPRIGRDAVLVPVPMHPSARRRRGFNQAGLLAGELSRRTNLRVLAGVLVKKYRTRRQSVVNRERRAENVRGVFDWTGSAIAGVHVLLVDDLVTSGATAAACVSVLKAAGAGKVTVLCFARAA